jgi:hypothetical protein
MNLTDPFQSVFLDENEKLLLYAGADRNKFCPLICIQREMAHITEML